MYDRPTRHEGPIAQKHACVTVARRRRQRGIALIWVAILGMVLVGLAGLALDTGYVLVTAHQLQNAADAAALAGANSVPFSTSQATADAVAMAASNNAAGAAVQLDAPAGDVIPGTYDRATATFSPGGSNPNAVKVTARRTTGSPGGPLNLIFAPMVGVTSSDVARQAIAMNNPLNAGVLLLNKTANPSLHLNGTGSNPAKINITNGAALVVDSNNAKAIDWTGKPNINASSLYVVGNETSLSGSSVYSSGNLQLQSPVMPDPLAWLPPPPQGTNQASATGPNLQPGYYPKGLPNGNLKLAGGVYYIDGNVNIGGNTTIDASAGVMIYLHTGGITMSGSSSIKINPPASGTYKGISFYQDRSNTSPDTLQGTPGASNSGVFYFPSAHLTIAGNPTSTASQLIADTLDIQGNTQLSISYDHGYPIPRHQSLLVY